MKDLMTYILEDFKSLSTFIYEADDFGDLGDLGGDDDGGGDDGGGDDEDKKDKKPDNKKSKEDKEEEKTTRRGNIKFTIWKSPKVKVKWMEDNDNFQKIEYQYEDDENNIEIDFLLGIQNKVWKLWVGKIGATSYDDDPYCSFDTPSFAEAIVKALDKVEEFIEEVEDDPSNWIQFYKDK